jgi:3-hydroxyisobutyrate dehydrogenase-like beta-hydroxyacid dehydrogenase
VDETLGHIAPKLGRDTIVVDHSTTLPVATAARAEHSIASGVRFLHAPVFMSPQACREGKGMMMVSGPPALFAAAEQALARMTGDLWYLGERSDLAAAFKLFGNSMLFAVNAGMADVLAMAKNLDVPGEDALGLFSRFNIAVAIPMRGKKMARQDFSTMFALAMARKDMGTTISPPSPLKVKGRR